MGNAIKVLIVDNDNKAVEAMNSIAVDYGFEIYSVCSGNEAIRLFQEINPNLVVLDIILRDMPGEIICAFIRQHSKVPIIVLSSKNDEQCILDCFNIGVDDYITKPFSQTQLAARINAILRRNCIYAKQRNPA